MKIAVIGAGSTYTPELVTGFDHVREHLHVDELVLMDLDRDRLDNVGAFAERILAARGLQTRVSRTVDLDEAVTDADAVLIQIRVGGQGMRLVDETLPLKFAQMGQETTGAGGAMKALRTVPVVLHIAERTRQLAKPNAWIVDFTNPVGIVTRALRDNGYRAVGLCNYAIGIQRWAASLLGVDHTRVLANPTGLNHFSWTRSILLDGEEVLPQILKNHREAVIERFSFPGELIDLVGAIPSYYLQWYYATNSKLESLRHDTPRAQQVEELESQLLEMYRDSHLTQRPALLENRGGAYYSEAAAELLASLLGDQPREHVINVRNGHLYPELAEDDIVETLCVVDGERIEPVGQDSMAPHILGPVQHVLAYERQISTAAQTGSIDEFRRALLTHPLIAQFDTVERMWPELLRGSERFLPLFSIDQFPGESR